MKPIDWRIVLIELFMAQGTPVFSHKTTIVMRQPRTRTRMRTTANLCKSTRYDPADSDRETFSGLTTKTFSDLAVKDSASRARSQGILQQIAPRSKGNSGREINREKGDVSRGRQLY